MRHATAGLVIRRRLGLAAAVLLMAGHAQGQEGAPATEPPKQAALEADEKRPVTARFVLGAENAFSTDLDGGGDVSVWRAGGWLGVRVPVEKYHVLDLEATSEFSFYDFGNASKLAPTTGDPIGSAVDTRVGARFFLRTAERWGLYLGGDIGSGGEPGAKFGDTISGGATGGFVYWINEHFSLGAGVNVRTRLGESVSVLPSVNLDWKLNDQFTLTTSTRIIDRGGGVTLSYAPAETVTLSLTGGYETRYYRLDDDGEAPGGVFSDLRFPLALGVAWKATPSLTLSARGGAHLWQEFTVRAANGDEIATDESGAQFFLGIGAEISF